MDVFVVLVCENGEGKVSFFGGKFGIGTMQEGCLERGRFWVYFV